MARLKGTCRQEACGGGDGRGGGEDGLQVRSRQGCKGRGGVLTVVVGLVVEVVVREVLQGSFIGGCV